MWIQTAICVVPILSIFLFRACGSFYKIHIRGYRIRYWTLYLSRSNDWFANIVDSADDPSTNGHHSLVTSSLCLEFMLGGWFRCGQGRILIRDQEVRGSILNHWSVSLISGRIDPLVELLDMRTNERAQVPVTTAIRFLNGPALEGKDVSDLLLLRAKEEVDSAAKTAA